MKKIVLKGKWVVYTFLFITLSFTTSCVNRTKKVSTRQKLEQEPKTAKKEAAVEEKQDSTMFKQKLQFFKKYDTNNDKKISMDEYTLMASQKFDKLDTNHDGKLTTNESDLVVAITTPGKKSVTKKEFLTYYKKKFQTMDKNEDGYIMMEELDVREN